jgi:hypothetical protein
LTLIFIMGQGAFHWLFCLYRKPNFVYDNTQPVAP